MKQIKKDQLKKINGGGIWETFKEACEDLGRVYYDKIHEEIFMPDKYDTDW